MVKTRLLFLGFTLAGFAAAHAADPVPADNSKLNERDRGSESVTPFDQSETKPDIETTAAIRRSIVKEPGLSSLAQNVKIVTRDGRVTLRGPVKDRNEKATVERLAHTAPGVSAIDSQLEVK